MSLVFHHRSWELERMDQEILDPATVSTVLRNLEAINYWLGGVRTTLWHFRQFSKRWQQGASIRIVDWGTGGADLPRALVRWGRTKGFKLQVVGVDQDKAIVEYARKACHAYPEIEIVHSDVRHFAANEPFDYAISSLTLHHLKNQHIVALLQRSDQLARRGIVMNDLRRSARAWAWIWFLSRLGRCHSMVQHDGPLSVRRAFTPEELTVLAADAKLPYLKTHVHFGHRLALAGEKN